MYDSAGARRPPDASPVMPAAAPGPVAAAVPELRLHQARAERRERVLAEALVDLFEPAGEENHEGRDRRLGERVVDVQLVPAQDESLTVRATRSAMAKLDGDPSRLLN